MCVYIITELGPNQKFGAINSTQQTVIITATFVYHIIVLYMHFISHTGTDTTDLQGQPARGQCNFVQVVHLSALIL